MKPICGPIGNNICVESAQLINYKLVLPLAKSHIAKAQAKTKALFSIVKLIHRHTHSCSTG